MANFKRKGPKSTRTGCLRCKPHKFQGNKKSFEHQTRQEQKARLSEKFDREDVLRENLWREK